MKDVFYDFDWTVARGYEWQDYLDDEGAPVVVPAEGTASLASATGVELAWEQSQKEGRVYGPLLSPAPVEGLEQRRYHPMEPAYSALFREFADLDYRDLSAIRAFASRYGGLGIPPAHQAVKRRGGDGELNYHSAYGESYLDWAAEICWMKEGLQLMAQDRTFEDSRRLKWLCDRNLQHLRWHLGFDSSGAPRLALTSPSLISTMWLQLVLAVTGEKSFVRCKFCMHVFEISTDQTGFRRHREFCSESCKTLDYRKRKRTALELAVAGMDAKVIAQKTATELRTVRGWLKAARSSRATAKKGGK